MYSWAKDDAPIRITSTMKLNLSIEKHENIITPINILLKHTETIERPMEYTWSEPIQAKKFAWSKMRTSK